MGYCDKSGPANMAADCFWPFRREGCPDFGDRYLLWCITNPNDGIISAVYFYPPLGVGRQCVLLSASYVS